MTADTALDASTAACALLGYPVRHSFSPAMQSAAFAAAGVNAVYLAFEVPEEWLESALGGLRALGFMGANVTVPHKVAAMRLVDEVDPEALTIGAVNTIVVRGGRLIGYNTDGEGFLRSLYEAGVEPKGRQALVIGAGGAARGVIAALARAGAGKIVVTNRTRDRAEELAVLARSLGLPAAVLPWEELPGKAGQAAIGTSELIIQTTTLGMVPRMDARPPIPERFILAGHVVCDLIYNPVKTGFLQRAEAVGARVISGMGMLLHQGAAAFELWTGRQAPLETMRAALQDQIVGRG